MCGDCRDDGGGRRKREEGQNWVACISTRDGGDWRSEPPVEMSQKGTLPCTVNMEAMEIDDMEVGM